MTTSAEPSPGFVGAIAEYFTLRRAEAVHDKLGELPRKRIAEALALGRQRAEAADALWSNGHAAEGLRLAVSALEATLTAVPAYAAGVGIAVATKPAPEDATDAKADDEKPESAGAADEAESAEKADAESAEKTGAAEEPEKKAEPAKPSAPTKAEAAPSAWSSVLAARGVAKDAIAQIDAASRAASSAALPLLDAEVSPTLADLYQQVMAARHTVDRALGVTALGRRDLLWTRIARIGTASVLTLGVVAGLYFALRTPQGTFAEASDTWGQSPSFAPSNIVDGSTSTWWLLPDRASGWVEARLSPPRHIDRVRLMNSANPPYGDRATHEYRLEVYSHGSVVQSVDGAFEYSDNPDWVAHDISADEVERVRFVVRSHHRTGAGLTEMEIE